MMAKCCGNSDGFWENITTVSWTKTVEMSIAFSLAGVSVMMRQKSARWC